MDSCTMIAMTLNIGSDAEDVGVGLWSWGLLWYAFAVLVFGAAQWLLWVVDCRM